MEKIKSVFEKPIALGVAGLVIGLVLGLVGLGWGLWPLKWVDAAPSDLQMGYQRDYLCMTIDSYQRNKDIALMQVRWQGLGEKSEELLSTLTPALCGFESEEVILKFSEVVNAGVLGAPAGALESEETAVLPTAGIGVPAEPQPEQAADDESISLMPFMILLLLTLAAGGALVFLLIKRRQAAGGLAPKVGRIKIREDAGIPVGKPETKISQNDPPLAQFMTTYRQGDDLYDDSFSVDSITGEFLGECGVGIAETIGVGEPKKVTALEVWLFDKNDIQTVTKVLLSEHANNDAAIKQRLLSKGEPIVAEPGMRFLMETASLQLEAKVVDMVYARGPLPENSYFSRLTMEISVWSK